MPANGRSRRFAADTWGLQTPERALKLDRWAAFESCSWGLGQVMGFNAVKVGFADVEAMVSAMLDSEDEQFQAMAGFIRAYDLSQYLAQGDWTNFAYHYNGSDFQKNRYDTKLARAHARYVTGPLPNLRVRAAQLYLGYLGFDPWRRGRVVRPGEPAGDDEIPEESEPAPLSSAA